MRLIRRDDVWRCIGACCEVLLNCTDHTGWALPAFEGDRPTCSVYLITATAAVWGVSHSPDCLQWLPTVYSLCLSAGLACAHVLGDSPRGAEGEAGGAGTGDAMRRVSGVDTISAAPRAWRRGASPIHIDSSGRHYIALDGDGRVAVGTEVATNTARRAMQAEADVRHTLELAHWPRLFGEHPVVGGPALRCDGLRGESEFVITGLEHGMALADLVAANALPYACIRRIFRDLLAALRSLHDSGKVHRALLPQTIVVDAAGRVRLRGFGTCVDLRSGVLVVPLDVAALTAAERLFIAPELSRELLAAAADGFADGPPMPLFTGRLCGGSMSLLSLSGTSTADQFGASDTIAPVAYERLRGGANQGGTVVREVARCTATTDMYSAGMLLLFMLTGAQFPHITSALIAAQAARGHPPPPPPYRNGDHSKHAVPSTASPMSAQCQDSGESGGLAGPTVAAADVLEALQWHRAVLLQCAVGGGSGGGGTLPTPADPALLDEVAHFIAACLHGDPTARPSVKAAAAAWARVEAMSQNTQPVSGGGTAIGRAAVS